MEAAEQGRNVLTDRFGRVHDYLRISVTDRCNLRCVYCMPADGLDFLPNEKVMTDDEIVEVIHVGAKLGIRKLRITGGEPTVRKGLPDLIRRLRDIPGIEDIALTTNGIRLAEMAQELHDAGVNRINISLDSMHPERFRKITRHGDFQKVWDGLLAAFRVGFDPIKINVVLVKDFNDDEVLDFVRLTLQHPLQIRFIEYMPIDHEASDWKGGYVSINQVVDQARAEGIHLQKVNDVKGNGPAEYYRAEGAPGTVGLIHPV